MAPTGRQASRLSAEALAWPATTAASAASWPLPPLTSPVEFAVTRPPRRLWACTSGEPMDVKNARATTSVQKERQLLMLMLLQRLLLLHAMMSGREVLLLRGVRTLG